MKKAVFVMLDLYADWEGAYLMKLLNQSADWEVKTASIQDKVKSLGGITAEMYYLISDIPKDIDLLILIGGDSWGNDHQEIVELLEKRLVSGVTVGIICGAVDFAARNGILTGYNHTGNSQYLWQDFDMYSNKQSFMEVQAVRDRNLITANGTAVFEFTEEVLKAIAFMEEESLEKQMFLERNGFYKYCDKYGNPFA